MQIPAQKVTIAILTDIHFGSSCAIAQRRSEIADVLMQRAVHRLNRLIRPDVTVVLGDVVDDGASPGAAGRLARIRAILDKLASPYIALPGNHDGDTESFYQVFDSPDSIVDLCGVRFLPFVDQQEPGYNASRRRADTERFREARNEYRGRIVALQHVCLAPPGQADIPYNYTNAEEIIASMREAGVELSLSGHHHAGAEPVRNGVTTFVNAPGLCEKPFPFLVVTLEGDDVRVDRRQLAMPEHLGLVDNHVHTELAYCSENMTVTAAISLARDFGLAGIGFAEHSGQLYFDANRYWGGQCGREGLAGALTEDNRMASYRELKRQYERNGVSFGLEVDVDFRGNLVLDREDRRSFSWIAGAIHGLPSLKTPAVTPEVRKGEYMFLLERLLEQQVAIVVHPFRVFRSAGYDPPADLFRPAAELLRQHQTAVEINFHINQPPIDFIRMCLEMDLKFSFGSDAHSLYEIGEFASHLKLLEDAGYTGDVSDILVAAPHLGARAASGVR